MTTRALVLLVAYGNHIEVESFVAHAKQVLGPHVEYAVCDNSANPKEDFLDGVTGVTLTTRSDNPGYLEGALVAMEAWRESHGALPDWVILSNSDLEIVSAGVLEELARYQPDTPVVLAPRITEGKESVEKNPHVVEPRTPVRHRMNAYAAFTPGLAFLYLAAAAVKRKFRLLLSRDAEAWRQSYPAGTQFYSPYGAVVVFSRGFFSLASLPRNVPLLAEEYFIAEAAANIQAPVIYEPRIHFHHSAHSTTGPKLTRRRAKGISRAFRAIARDAASRKVG